MFSLKNYIYTRTSQTEEMTEYYSHEK